MVNDQINLDKESFENIEEAWKGDLWERKRLGIQLTQYVDRLQCGAVLALDAKWGEGKTWFVRHWAKHLSDTDHNVIYLAAFANDYLDDPFLVITSEIANILKKDKSTKGRVNKLVELSASVGMALLPSIPKVALTLGLHLVGAGLLSGVLQQGYENAKEGIEALSDEASERIKVSIQEKIAGHEAEKETLKEFKKHLADTVEKLENPLVFIIDELDRCRPDFAIRLIERIKHFFDIKKIVFVLVMNRDNLGQAISNHYGYVEESSEKYLDKFIDFVIPLPKISQVDENVLMHFDVIRKLLLKVGEEVDDICLIFYLGQYGCYLSPRQLKRKINQYALLKTEDSKKNLFLAIAIMQGPEKLVEKITETIKTLSVIETPSGFSFGNYELKKYEVESIRKIIESKFKIRALLYMELIKSIINIEIEVSRRVNSQEYKRESYNNLLQGYALKNFANYYELSHQYELYLKAHLWD